MPHPLDGCLAKLNRGEEQLHALKDAVNEFRASEFFEPSLEVDRQGRVAIRALNVREPPTSLAVLAGECANSFRSGLDYLAYQLAIQHSGDPLPQRIARATQYPILSSGPKFRERAPRQLVGITPKARAAIERLQPYHRKLVPNARSLRWLHEISNVDKHRDLHPIGSMLVGSQVGIASSSGRWTLDQYELFPGPLTERAMLARFTGEFEGEVQFIANTLHDVVFARDCAAPSVREQSVLFTLLAVRDFLALELVPALAVFFRGEYQVRRSGPG